MTEGRGGNQAGEIAVLPIFDEPALATHQAEDSISASISPDDIFLSNLKAASPQNDYFPPLNSTSTFNTADDNHSLYGSTPTSAITSITSTVGNADIKTAETSPNEASVRKNMFDQTLFPNWQCDAAHQDDLGNPEAMQKKDPLAAQVWKFYHKAKTQLPNGERMENLTWRMMSMNLRRKELERQRLVLINLLYVNLHMNFFAIKHIIQSQLNQCELKGELQKITKVPNMALNHSRGRASNFN